MFQALLDCGDLCRTRLREEMEVEFTIDNEQLFILDAVRVARSERANVRIAVTLAKDQVISREEAVLRIPPRALSELLHSQIDPESKELIHQTLAEFIQGRTTILITHRLSTLDLVDRIMLMRDGRVVDCGSHEQLLGRCEEYRRMRNFGLEAVA